MPGRELGSAQSHWNRTTISDEGTKQAPSVRDLPYYLYQIHPGFSKTDYLLTNCFLLVKRCLLVNFPKLFAKSYTTIWHSAVNVVLPTLNRKSQLCHVCRSPDRTRVKAIITPANTKEPTQKKKKMPTETIFPIVFPFWLQNGTHILHCSSQDIPSLGCFFRCAL